MKWNIEEAEKVVRECERLTGVTADFTVTDRVKNGEIMDIREEKRELGISPLMCSDEDIPDSIVRQCIFLAFCGLENEKLELGRLWHSAVRKAEQLCEQTGTEFTDFEDIENYIRPVRRRLFPDPKDGGCYFRVGDILRGKAPCSGECKFIVTDMEASEEGIMVSCRMVPGRYYPDDGITYTEEERVVFERFNIYERKS